MRFTTFAAASALAALANAQTFTDCNPMEKECPNDPAMPQNFETDFTAGKDAIKGWKQTAGSLTYNNEGAVFSVAKQGDAPTIGSETYLHFGYVEVKMKAAPGQGIVSSIVLQSDNLDEVDWEWIGGVDNTVQQNYFGKGNTTTYDRMIEASVGSTQNEFHTYALNWTSEALTWIIDGKPTRTLKYADANGGKNFPQTPCNVRLGNWPAGDSKDEGTVSWAGGKVDYTKGPFNMTVASIKVINYSPGTEYHFKDKSGSFESIEVVGAGNKDGAPQNTAVLETSATASGAPFESGFAAPSVTGGISNSTSTTCTEGQAGATPAPSNPGKTPATAVSGGQSDFNYPVPTGSGSKPVGGSSGSGNGNGTVGEAPCDCGTATVTVTGTPPSGDAPPATQVPSAPASSPVLGGVGSSPAAAPPASSPVGGGAGAPPATLTSVVSPPSSTTGLIMETAPAPSVPVPSAPTGALPPSTPSAPSGGNATAPVTSAPAEFTGAASANRAGAMVAGAVAGVGLFAF